MRAGIEIPELPKPAQFAEANELRGLAVSLAARANPEPQAWHGPVSERGNAALRRKQKEQEAADEARQSRSMTMRAM
jgi:hypothetical protein